MTRVQRRSRRLRLPSLAVGAGLGIALSGSALALSLGAPQTHSFLTEPLLLRLPLRLESRDADPSSLQVRLLPASAYAALGFPLPGHALSDLQAAIVGSADGGYWVSIRSNHALREPVLSLLVELRSPGSSWIRSIDLLLDPPPAALKAPHAAAMVTAQAPAPLSRQPSRPPPPAPGLRTTAASRYYGPVRPGESLSRIAQRVRRDASLPLATLVSALYATNRAAFDGSPDRLRVGSTLLIPELAAGTPTAADGVPAAAASETADRDIAAAPAGQAQATSAALHYLEGPLFGLELQLSSGSATAPGAAWPARFRRDWTPHPRPLAADAVQSAAEPMTAPLTDEPLPTEAALAAPAATDAWQTAADVMREPELAAAPEPALLPLAPPAAPSAAAVPAVREPAARLAWQWPALALLRSAGLLARWRRRSAERDAVARRRVSYRPPAMPHPAAGFTPPQPTPAATASSAQAASTTAAPATPGEDDFAERAVRTQIEPMMDTIVTQTSELEFDFPLDDEELRTALSAELEEIEQERDDRQGSRLSSLHLRLTALLADDPDATVRRDAKLALACLEGGDAEQAETIVLRLEAGNRGPADAGDPGKIVEFPRQHRQS